MRLLLILLAFCIMVPIACAHTIQQGESEPQYGRILDLSDSLINFRTSEGDKTIIRNPNNKTYSDIVVTGFPFMKSTYKNIPCKVTYMDNEYVYALTPDGESKIHKLKVRDVIIYIPD